MPAADEQYHAIKLLDATATAKDAPAPSSPGSDTAPGGDKNLEHTSSDNWLVRQGRARGGTVRKEWTKHKYARFQDGRDADDDSDNTTGLSSQDDNGPRAVTKSVTGKSIGQNEGKGKAISRVASRREGDIGIQKVPEGQVRSGRLRDRLPIPHRQRHKRIKKAGEDFAVDVLYENQRGAFFCGIPLYSANSLLNFDPAAWQTADMSDSPVNITNAQVPDPTWAWDWPCWYVDMSHDVDDQGWEYSLSFRQGFSWHGSQPWFTSFVRRRRWLRKRVRVRRPALAGSQHTMHEAHVLNPDYFTIHTGAGSRESSLERSTYRASTFGPLSQYTNENDSETDSNDAEITSIGQLFRRLRETTIDRKKLDAFRNFVQHGGDELAILPEQMEEIISLFLYQNSRRQVLLELEQALYTVEANEKATSAKSAGKQPEEQTGKDGVSGRDPGLSIQSALNAIATQVKELEYYSDAKAVSSPLSASHPEFDNASVISTRHDDNAAHGESDDEDEVYSSPTREGGDFGFRIKGIPAAAHIGENVGLAARVRRAREQQEESELKAQAAKQQAEP